MEEIKINKNICIMSNKLTKNKEYGVLTEISKGVNKFLGDTSDRTVSRRTTHGFKKAFGLTISDGSAEDITHVAMVYSGFHLLCKKGNRTIGLVSLLLLIALYHNG